MLNAGDQTEKLGIKQLHDDVLGLGISVIYDDGFVCRFKCQNVTYTAAWHELYPVKPPL